MNLRRQYLGSILLLLSINMFAQTGKEFWFVAPDATNGHGDRPIYLNLSAYDDSAYVKISQPANPAFTPIYAALAQSASQRINLTPRIADVETTVANTVLNNGILIESTGDISVYYEIAPNNNTDIFALKASNALGNHFLISAQSFWRSAGKYTPKAYNSAIIVASEDSTLVEILPSNNIQGHPASTPYSVILNRGETYMLKAVGGAVNDRFGGTEIISNKPIAVTISDDSIESSYGGCKDVIGDQTIPLDQLGTEYILVKGFLGQNPDRIYVMGTEDETEVLVDGGGPNDFTVGKGRSHELVLQNASVHLKATKEVYVMHVSGFGCEVGMAIVPSVYCTGSREISFVRSQSGDFYMIVFVPLGAEDDFAINGNTQWLVPADFSAVPGTGGQWVSARKYFNNNKIKIGANYRVTNRSRNFHLGIINGGSTTGCLYGYFTDFSGVKTDPIYRY